MQILESDRDLRSGPRAVGWAVGGGCQGGLGRLLSVTNAIEVASGGQWLGAGQGFFRIIKNQGGGDPSPKTPSPPPQTNVTIVGKNEIYNRENLVRPFLVHQVLGPKPPPPLPPPAQKKPWRRLCALDGGGVGRGYPPPLPMHPWGWGMQCEAG